MFPMIECEAEDDDGQPICKAKAARQGWIQSLGMYVYYCKEHMDRVTAEWGYEFPEETK